MSEEQKPYTVSFTGEAKALVVPDLRVLYFTVERESKKNTEAAALQAAALKQLYDALRESGVVEKDVKTLSYTLQEKYEWDGKKQRLMGWAATQRLSVELPTDEAGKVLAAVIAKGVSVDGVSTKVSNLKALQEGALNLAIDNATAKASLRAKRLSMKLGRVVNFSENDMGGFRPPRHLMDANPMMMAASAKGGGLAPELPTGEMEVSANVTVTYELL